NIINNYSKIKVMGYKFNLENIYISLRVSRGKNGYIYIKNHGEKGSYTTQELVSFDKTFDKNKIVVIADPGKGKTTLLKYLRWFVSKSINGISAVLIKLKDYEKSNLELLSIVIDDFQSKAASKRENIITALENGKLIILLDGLDEVEERLQSGIVKKIEKFTNIYSKCRFILTLRETLYKEYERKESEVTEFIDRCSLFEIDDLANDEIKKFVKAFYDEVLVGQGNDKIDEKVYELLSSINKNLEIRKMSKNPLLLSVLSLVGKDKELPKYRNELYRECTIILIDRKDKSIDECLISKIELLMDIAYGAFIDGGKSEFDLGELMTKIQNFIENRKDCKDCLASKCIKSLCNDSGILKSFGNRKYGFIHRTFCEYYAALKLKKLTFNDVCSKMESVMWEEPLKLYAAELDNISDSKNFIEKVWVVNRKLAIRCFTEMKFVNKKMVEGLLKETKVSERIELVEGLVFVEHNEKENNAGAMLDILIVFLELQRDLEIMSHVILKLRSIQRRFENTENADNKEISIEIDKIIEKYTGSKEAKRDRYKKYIEDFMVDITGGEFMMGSPENESEREDIEVLHRVRVDSFKMMKHTVTLDLFNKVMDGEGVKFYRDNDRGSNVWNSDKTEWELKSGVNFKCDVNGNYRQDQSHPVIHVNWYEAWMFCELLGCKLPTEAQWEYACRATTNVETLDTEVADKNVCTNMPFNTGENLPTDKSNYNGNYPYNNNPKGEYKQDTMPVMSYEANDFGLFEMHGNVWEWCNDWYDENYYKVCIDENIIENPSGPEESSYCVLRGGSWDGNAGYCRSANRGHDYPSSRDYSPGFRVVGSP
ncbi:MAG: SUMF1/EgtB/PvdO family nonheme iron enzyme, partial [Clostridiales bacterium]